MNREDRRRLGLKEWVVILGVYKEAETQLVGVEKKNEPQINSVAIKVLADGPTSAVGIAAGILWDDATKKKGIAPLIGASVMTLAEFEKMQKQAATPKEAEVVDLKKVDNPEEKSNTNNASSPQGNAQPEPRNDSTDPV